MPQGKLEDCKIIPSSKKKQDIALCILEQNGRKNTYIYNGELTYEELSKMVGNQVSIMKIGNDTQVYTVWDEKTNSTCKGKQLPYNMPNGELIGCSIVPSLKKKKDIELTILGQNEKEKTYIYNGELTFEELSKLIGKKVIIMQIGKNIQIYPVWDVKINSAWHGDQPSYNGNFDSVRSNSSPNETGREK